MNRRDLLVSTLVTSFVGPFLQGQDDLDPLKVTPQTHKLLFENQYVRVIESRSAPGGTEPKHSHPRSVTVYLADADSEIRTFPDEKVARVHRTAGTAGWSEATTHAIKNVGSTPSHTIRIELKC
jgi:hypothetical protein